MAHYTIQQLYEIQNRRPFEPTTKMISRLIEDLLDAYRLLDEQAEKYLKDKKS
jgi:hypothetical protein